MLVHDTVAVPHPPKSYIKILDYVHYVMVLRYLGVDGKMNIVHVCKMIY